MNSKINAMNAVHAEMRKISCPASLAEKAGHENCVPTGRRYLFYMYLLNSSFSSFIRADTDGFIQRYHKDFAVADFPGFGGLADNVDGLYNHFVAHSDLKFNLRKEIDRVLAAAVDLCMTFLA